MDHHDWADWSEDDGGLGEHDTADLGTPDHFDGLGGHDHVESFDADHDPGHYDTPPGPRSPTRSCTGSTTCSTR